MEEFFVSEDEFLVKAVQRSVAIVREAIPDDGMTTKAMSLQVAVLPQILEEVLMDERAILYGDK
jgi:hypothetical protein